MANDDFDLPRWSQPQGGGGGAEPAFSPGAYGLYGGRAAEPGWSAGGGPPPPPP
jgi:hypothetical protein